MQARSTDRARVSKVLGVLCLVGVIGGCNGGSTTASSGSGAASGSGVAHGSAIPTGHAVGSSGSASAAGSDRAGGSAPAQPSKLTCEDLPGATRTGLQLSADGKTAYYVELAVKPGDRRDISVSLHAFDLARRVATLVAADVSADVAVADDGTAVFTRPLPKFDDIGYRRRALIAMPPGKEAIPLTGDNDDVGDFAVDRATSTIVFIRGDPRNQLTKLPVAGGKPVKISAISAYQILGIAGDSVFVSQTVNVSRRPIAGGASSEIADLHDSRFLGVHGDRLVLLGKSNHKLSIVSVSAPKKRIEPSVPTEELVMSQIRDQAHLIARHGDAYEVRKLDNLDAPPVLVTRGVRPVDVVRIQDRLLLLATVDTNHDEVFDGIDETDLCFAEPGPDPIEVHTRTVPKQVVDVAARLAPLTASGPLAGANLRFEKDDLVELTATLPPGTDLRALVQDTQARLTQLAAQPHLSLTLRDRTSGQRVDSQWSDSAGAFLVWVGMGNARLPDLAHHLLAVDPKVTRVQTSAWREDTICNGTIQNISDHELSNIEVECPFLGEEDHRRARGKLQPNRLAPSGRGTYRILLDYPASSHIGVEVFVDGKLTPYVNTYANNRMAKILAAATKVHDATQLDYWSVGSYRTGVYERNKVLAIYVRAAASFEQATPAAREAAAAKALSQLRAVVTEDGRLSGAARLLILRGDGERIGWTYTQGKLTDGRLQAD